MKKIIIATAIILTSGITAFSLSSKKEATNTNNQKIKVEAASFASKNTHGSKSDLATSD